ncbi:MAG: glycoside hydrolase family 18 protein [Bacteroidota bacterium]
MSVLLCKNIQAQSYKFRVVGYYAGRTIAPDSFQVEKLTHLIWCFGHLNGNELSIANATDSSIIQQMVALKARNPRLKVMLSLGGWGGCEHCSTVFSSEEGRAAFAKSAKQLNDYFHTDGIDLDWEYPVVKGFPGHRYSYEDKNNFTALVKTLRATLSPINEISFAAGGFTNYIDSAIDWNATMPYIDFINVMSYDLVHGYSTVSGHHTPLYSTPQQIESTDNAVNLLLDKGVPAEKIVIGAAFYGRFFKMTTDGEVDLYQPCKFEHGFSYKYASDSLSGFTRHWDNLAKAPYAINKERRLLATYDDERSVGLKTRYALTKNLGGIMFWQLYDDKFSGGLLDAIVGDISEVGR